MRCADATRQLQLYIDSRLTLDQLRALESHLAYCSACQTDLFLLEEVTYSIRSLSFVAEPENMTAQIMQRVAVSTQRHHNRQSSWLRPSLLELLIVIVLATITTLGIILNQPSLRAVLPFANGHDSLSLAFINMLHMLLTGDIGALTWVLWIGGTILGISITLALAGNEMRSEWFKAMLERLPVR